MKKISIFVLMMLSTAFMPDVLLVNTAYASTDNKTPSSAKFKVYKVYMYNSEYCTGSYQTPFTYSDTEAELKEYVGTTPDLGSGTLDNGTYKCMAVNMSDNITFQIATDFAGHATPCLKDTTYWMDLCNNRTYYDPDSGDNNTCTNDYATAEKTWMYMSTVSDTTYQTTPKVQYHPPTADNTSAGITLGGALVVSGDSSGKLVIDLREVIDNASGGNGVANGATMPCYMNAPKFSFE